MNSGVLLELFNKAKMNESRLNEDLKALSKRPRPNLPTDFNATVWSKIQSRETPICWRDRRTGLRRYSPHSVRLSGQLLVSLLDFWPVGVWAESRQVRPRVQLRAGWRHL